MGFYPVAAVQQKHKKHTSHKTTHNTTIHNTQNYKYGKTHILHRLNTQDEYLNLTKNLK